MCVKLNIMSGGQAIRGMWVQITGRNMMAWSLTADFTETCSCNMLCPCWFGVKELMIMDQGYCAGALLFRVSQASADGVDLSGRVVPLAADWPGPPLIDGNGPRRLYVDVDANPAQCP